MGAGGAERGGGHRPGPAHCRKQDAGPRTHPTANRGAGGAGKGGDRFPLTWVQICHAVVTVTWGLAVLIAGLGCPEGCSRAGRPVPVRLVFPPPPLVQEAGGHELHTLLLALLVCVAGPRLTARLSPRPAPGAPPLEHVRGDRERHRLSSSQDRKPAGVWPRGKKTGPVHWALSTLLQAGGPPATWGSGPRPGGCSPSKAQGLRGSWHLHCPPWTGLRSRHGAPTGPLHRGPLQPLQGSAAPLGTGGDVGLALIVPPGPAISPGLGEPC